jgi:Xaa-Pro aminopeptidase
MNFRNRIEEVRKLILKKHIDAALISSPHNKFYLGGLFSGSGYVFITKESQYIIVDFRYFEEVKYKNQLFHAILLSSENTLEKILNHIIKIEGLCQIGFEGSEISYDFYSYLHESLNCSLCSLDLSKIRMIKETEEIENIKKACNIADKAFNHIASYIKDGMSERKVENELIRFIKEQGGQKESFDSIVASGVRGALPHGKASDKIIKEGEFITLDFGVKYNDYCSDITRTIALGNCQEELVHIYEVVKAAGEEAMRNAKPNLTVRELDHSARNLIKEAGYEEYFRHNLGHGLGIQVHEYPAVETNNTELLREGMIITIEPGIYLPEVGGVRIEEDVLITTDGCVKLTNSSRELIII